MEVSSKVHQLWKLIQNHWTIFQMRKKLGAWSSSLPFSYIIFSAKIMMRYYFAITIQKHEEASVHTLRREEEKQERVYATSDKYRRNSWQGLESAYIHTDIQYVYICLCTYSRLLQQTTKTYHTHFPPEKAGETRNTYWIHVNVELNFSRHFFLSHSSSFVERKKKKTRNLGMENDSANQFFVIHPFTSYVLPVRTL